MAIDDEGRDDGLLFEERVSEADRELGAYLREERERRDVSLKEVADTTRIKLRYLEAIEEGNFGALPADPIVKGFLRAYARHLGIDGDPVVERYNRFRGHPGVDIEGLGPEVLESEEEGGSRLKVVLVVLSILVAGAAFYFVQGHFRRAPLTVAKREAPPAKQVQPAQEPSPEVRVAPPEEPSPPQGPGKAETEAVATDSLSDREVSLTPSAPAELGEPAKPEEIAKPTEIPPPEAAPAEKPSASGDRMVLSVKAIEDTWLRVVVDETSQYEVLLSAGNSREWEAKEKFVITIGNVAGTKISLNEQEVVLPPTSTNVIHDFSITRRPQS